MKEIRNDLSNNKLRIPEYYAKATNVFKIMLKEDKKWLFTFIFLELFTTVLILYNSYLKKIGVFELENNTISMLSILIYTFINTLFINKIITKIEEKKELTLCQIILRTLIWIGLVFVLSLLRTDTYNSFEILNFKLLRYFLLIAVVFIYFNILYFSFILISKNMSFIEIIKYNFELSKGNRLRMIIVLAPITLLNSSLIRLEQSGHIPLFFLVIIEIIKVFVSFYVSILGTLIFLNVDYINRKEKL